MGPLHPTRCCLLVIDVQPENHAIGLGLMREAGGSITSTGAVLMGLLGEARGELFKETLAFLKGR